MATTKQPSLAAQSGALKAPEGGMSLPDVFQAPTAAVVGRQWSPYLTFAHQKRSDEWNKITAAMGSPPAEGDLFLVDNDKVIAQPSCKCAAITWRQYWSQTNAAGTELIAVSLEEMPHPFKEQVEMVLVVYLQDRVLPCNVLFRTTKCPAAKALSEATLDAGGDSWAGRSEGHKLSMCCPSPWQRYIGVVEMSPPRTSKQSGLPYRTTTCRVQPTTLVEWRLMKAFCDDAGTNKLLKMVADRFAARCEEVQKKVK